MSDRLCKSTAKCDILAWSAKSDARVFALMGLVGVAEEVSCLIQGPLKPGILLGGILPEGGGYSLRNLVVKLRYSSTKGSKHMFSWQQEK